MKKGLDYIFNQQTEIVIMGTFPSEKSRNICYYNNPQNQFWKIIADIFNTPEIIIGNAAERYACLLKYHIGLWDVIKTCDIEVSCDNDIKNPQYNDFSKLKKICPNLKHLVFNSKNAKKLFARYLKQETDEPLKIWLLQITDNLNNVLPSTSPANARKNAQQKLDEWKNFITNHLNN